MVGIYTWNSDGDGGMIVSPCLGLNTGSTGSWPFGESPRLRANDLAFTIGPEVDAKADELVDGGIGALVDESRSQGSEREECQARLEASVEGASSKEAERPFPCNEDEPKDQVNDL